MGKEQMDALKRKVSDKGQTPGHQANSLGPEKYPDHKQVLMLGDKNNPLNYEKIEICEANKSSYSDLVLYQDQRKAQGMDTWSSTL
jgi:hypothetical protein